VRRLCAECRRPVVLTEAHIARIKKRLEAVPEGIPVPEQSRWTVYEPASGGCHACNQTGYKGRVLVFEAILANKEMERLILHDPTESEIRKEALRQRQTTMHQDGLLKVLAGVTDFGEVERALGAETE